MILKRTFKVFADFFILQLPKVTVCYRHLRNNAVLKKTTFNCFDVEKLDIYLQQLPAKLSCGPKNSIPSFFLKKLHCFFSLPLSLIFQKFHNCGRFPSEWKNANVVPISKGKGKKSDCSNCRPIG